MFARRQFLMTIAVLPFSFPVLADDNQAASRQREILFQRLHSAPSEREGRRVEQAIWQMWMEDAPSGDVREAVAQAMRLRDRYDWDGALSLLNRVITDAPRYAEGWNQRAFVRFLKQDFDGSLEDIEQALLREPLHFAALAGKATILMQQGRMDLGQKALRKAVEIHPWLKERSMLIPVPGQTQPGTGRGI